MPKRSKNILTSIIISGLSGYLLYEGYDSITGLNPFLSYVFWSVLGVLMIVYFFIVKNMTFKKDKLLLTFIYLIGISVGLLLIKNEIETFKKQIPRRVYLIDSSPK